MLDRECGSAGEYGRDVSKAVYRFKGRVMRPNNKAFTPVDLASAIQKKVPVKTELHFGYNAFSRILQPSMDAPELYAGLLLSKNYATDDL